MASEPERPTELDGEGLLHRVRAERRALVPFVGAGLAQGAGAPSAGALSQALADLVGSEPTPFSEAVRIAEERLSIEAVQTAVAQLFAAHPCSPTALLTRLAQWPARRILTTNYDDAVELSVERSGLDPVVLDVRSDQALRPPDPGTVQVIHLHGRWTERSSLVLPGQTTSDLREDELFITNLRAVLQQHAQIFLGFSLSSSEFALREVLRWLTRVEDGRQHLLVLPAAAGLERGGDLAQLRDRARIAVALDDDADHGLVEQVASAGIEPADPSGQLSPTVGDSTPPGWLLPPVVEHRRGENLERLEHKVSSAEHGWGETLLMTEDLLKQTPAILVASFGMGKTELLRQLARQEHERPALVIVLKGLPAMLLDEEDPLLAVARLIGEGQAGSPGVRPPDVLALGRRSFTLLLDGLDEVGAACRAQVVDAVTKAMKEWAQHRWLVASRPCDELDGLEPVAVRRLRMLPSAGWTRRYLGGRGISEEVQAEVRADRSDFGGLMGIPLFAAAVADRLLDGGPLAATPLELLLDVHDQVVDREARRWARSAEELRAWLSRLAVGLELRGRSEAEPFELAAVPAAPGLEPSAGRQRLVQASLLAELPGRAAFVRRTLQEVLCADALLRAPDTVATVKTVAVGLVGDEQHLRDDIPMTLDLVWESADRAVRDRLRPLDQERWARTVVARGTQEDAREALAWLWDYYDTKGSSFGIWNDGLRSARAAVIEILRRWPGLMEERQDEMLEHLRSPQAHRRLNALNVLSSATSPPPAVSELIPELVRDSSPAVSQLAVALAGRYQILAAGHALEALAFDDRRADRPRILESLVALIEEPDNLLALAHRMAGRHGALRELFKSLRGRLGADLDRLIELLGIRSDDPELGQWLLSQLLDNVSGDDWSPARAEALTRALFRSGFELQAEQRRHPNLVALLARHGRAMAQAAADELSRQPMQAEGLLLFDAGPDEALVGPELEALRAGLATAREWAAELKQRTVWPHPAEVALERLDDPRASAREVLSPDIRWYAERLDATRRARLLGLVESHWPAPGTLEGFQAWRGIGDDELTIGVVNAAGALGLPLDEERWLQLVVAPEAFERAPSASGWLRQTWDPAFEPALLELLEDVSDGHALSAVVVSVPPNAHRVLWTVVRRLDASDDPRWWSNTLGLLGERLGAEPARSLLLGERQAQQRAALVDDLAAFGDPLAQVEVLAKLHDQPLPGGSVGVPHWREPVSDPQVLHAAGRLYYQRSSAGAEDNTRRFALGLLSHASSVEALHVLDDLMADPAHRGLWLTRQALAGHLATFAVLERLPTDLGEVARLVESEANEPARQAR